MTDATKTVEQARREVAQIAAEIQRLSQSPLEPPDFCGQFLQLLMKAVGTRAGVVWTHGTNGQVGPAAEQRFEITGIRDDERATAANGTLLRELMATGQARCIPAEHEAVQKFPQPHLVILAPIQRGEECIGVVELFHNPETPEPVHARLLEFVEQMAGHASRFFTYSQRRTTGGQVDPFWQELSELTLELQSTLKPKQVAAVAANDSRLLLKCDRVSVACFKGRTLNVQAVSGQDSVHHRANLIRGMVRLAKRVIPSGKTFAFGDSAAETPPPLKEPLADLLAESGARRLVMVPLFESESFEPDKDKEKSGKSKVSRKDAFGCLIVEQFAQDEGDVNLVERSEIVADHVAAAMTNARAHHRIFLRSVFGAIGSAREWLSGRRLAKLLVILSLLVGIGLFFALYETEYRVEAQGQLMPAKRRAVFATREGEIAELFVKDGQRIKQGQRLLRIENNDLESQYNTKRRELPPKLAERDKLQGEYDTAVNLAKREEASRLHGQLAQIDKQIAGIKSETALLKIRIDKLTLRSPIDGVVTTFRLRELLLGRPVQRGDVLLEIADDSGPWRLELDVEEQRMGHLLRAKERNRKPLNVDFVLATDPTSTFAGKLRTVASQPKHQQEKGSLVEVFVSINKGQQLKQRIGAEVRAKVHCGQRSLGYVWFGDVVEFVRRRWWW